MQIKFNQMDRRCYDIFIFRVMVVMVDRCGCFFCQMPNIIINSMGNVYSCIDCTRDIPPFVEDLLLPYVEKYLILVCLEQMLYGQ